MLHRKLTTDELSDLVEDTRYMPSYASWSEADYEDAQAAADAEDYLATPEGIADAKAYKVQQEADAERRKAHGLQLPF